MYNSFVLHTVILNDMKHSLPSSLRYKVKHIHVSVHWAFTLFFAWPFLLAALRFRLDGPLPSIKLFLSSTSKRPFVVQLNTAQKAVPGHTG